MDKSPVQNKGTDERDEIEDLLRIPSREQLILRLRQKPEDPETQALLQRWISVQERMAEAAPDYMEAQIRLNVERAQLYFEAGLLESARENYEDALTYAEQSGRQDLYLEISRKKTERGL